MDLEYETPMDVDVIQEVNPYVPITNSDKIKEKYALAAINEALNLQTTQHENAFHLLEHALTMLPLHPDILNYHGELLELRHNIIMADHLYSRALTINPRHAGALGNRKRTLPAVDKLASLELEEIDRKLIELIQLNPKLHSLKQVKQEIFFQHIHHSVAIEGNTMTLAETKNLIKTGRSVAGKSVVEQSEVIALESALLYINKMLVKERTLNVKYILKIHKRVLGHVAPLEAGLFRLVQVYVGEHVPPLASKVAFLMKEFADCLQSHSFQRMHPVQQAALAHYNLVAIHPFIDGNGRTARLVMNINEEQLPARHYPEAGQRPLFQGHQNG